MAKTVLIVEDNELNMKLFNDLLEAHGYLTIQTRNGVEAVELAHRHKPDLILWIFNCRKSLACRSRNGSRTMKNLAHIPVIAVTAFAMKGDEERIRQGGCEAYLSKPIQITKFLETVRNYMGDS